MIRLTSSQPPGIRRPSHAPPDSLTLQENDETIEYATEVAIHADPDADGASADDNLGSAYDAQGEYDKAIENYEKDLGDQFEET